MFWGAGIDIAVDNGLKPKTSGYKCLVFWLNGYGLNNNTTIANVIIYRKGHGANLINRRYSSTGMLTSSKIYIFDAR